MNKEQLKEIIVKALGVTKQYSIEEFKRLSADDIESWDSIGHLQLVSEIEKITGIELSIEEVSLMDSVRKIIEILQEKNILE